MSTPGRQEMMMANGALRFVILDLSLGNGLDRLGKIRSRSNVPAIITTGDRGDEIDPAAGLELGVFALPSNRPDLCRPVDFGEGAPRPARVATSERRAACHSSPEHPTQSRRSGLARFQTAHGGDFPATLQG
jgi:hypothetical protein